MDLAESSRHHAKTWVSLQAHASWEVPTLQYSESLEGEMEKLKNGPPACVDVLDFTWVPAGPHATTASADLGAVVFKIEHYKVGTNESLQVLRVLKNETTRNSYHPSPQPREEKPLHQPQARTDTRSRQEERHRRREFCAPLLLQARINTIAQDCERSPNGTDCRPQIRRRGTAKNGRESSSK